MKTAFSGAGARVDAGLLWLRVAGSALLFYVHGWPKLVHFQAELARIEDPFGFGAPLSLAAAIAAEVLCPVLIAGGLFTRAASLPVLAVLAVHPGWSIAEGQFGWLLIVIFGTIALCGPGRWSLDAVLPGQATSRAAPSAG
jgi:putative oxidoreductase